jgi:LytS/YehU family sensor histidine kinase
VGKAYLNKAQFNTVYKSVKGRAFEPRHLRSPDELPFFKNDRTGPLPFEKKRLVFRLPPFSFYSVIFVWLASITIAFIRRWQLDEKRKLDIEKENISTELSFLKQQINPHFLFNALNNIYSLTLNASQPASTAILKLSSILRYMLYETENKWVNLADEIRIIDDYIELQKLRLTDDMDLHYKVNGDPSNKKIAPLLLFPLIENAFKHGIGNIYKTKINILIEIGKDMLCVDIRNLIANLRRSIGKDFGIGIKNIKRRLDLLYPEKHTLEISEEHDSFSVLLFLKLNDE